MTHELTLHNVADALLAEGLAGAQELRALEAELSAFAAAEDTVVSLPRIVQIRATCPA